MFFFGDFCVLARKFARPFGHPTQVSTKFNLWLLASPFDQGLKVFFDLESNFVNRKSYQIHQDVSSLSVSSSCIVRIASGHGLISSKPFLCPYVAVILH